MVFSTHLYSSFLLPREANNCMSVFSRELLLCEGFGGQSLIL